MRARNRSEPPGGPVSALHGRRACVVRAGDGSSARTSAGGVRGARWAAAAARAVGAERLRQSALCARLALPRLAAGARLQPKGATGGSKAAPGGLAQARRCPRATLRLAGATGTRLGSYCDCLRVSSSVARISRFCRDVISVSSYTNELCSY